MNLPPPSYLRRDPGKFYCQLIPATIAIERGGGRRVPVAKIELLGQLEQRPPNESRRK